jgi:hypothetical protein
MTLTRTHLSPKTGKKELCTATVRECRFGGHEVVNSDADTMAEFYAEVPAAAYANISHPAIHRALTSDLNYTGPKPKWWAKHESEVTKHAQFPSKVALLDVIDTPAGKVAVVWQELSHRDNDKGVIADSGMNVQTFRYLDFKSGKSLGYLNLSNMDQTSFERSFGTDEFAPFRYEERYNGHSIGLRDYAALRAGNDGPGYHNLEGEELLAKRREVWLSMRQASYSDFGGYTLPDGKWLASYQLSAEHTPDDATVQRELKEMSKALRAKIKKATGYYGTPFVDYSRVEGPLGNKGFGSTLYIYGARHLAQRNQALRGSGIQSDEAQAMWDRLEKNIPQHVKKIKKTYRGETDTYRILDFRG